MNIETIGAILFFVLIISHWIVYSTGYDRAFKDYAGSQWQLAQRKARYWNEMKKRVEAFDFENFMELEDESNTDQ